MGITSSISARFAFHPPNPPTYSLLYEEEAQRFRIPELPRRDDVDVLKLRTRRRHDIVAVYVRSPKARATVLYSHGNAADLCQLFQLFSQLSLHLRVNLIGYDYSGYGRSTGKPSEYNTYADIEAVYYCLREQYAVRAEDIILYGQSVGSGPTVHLASRVQNFRAVVLQSPILSGIRVIYPVKRTFWFDIYKNVDKITLVDCPVLVMHGTEDEIVDVSHGKQLWELCKKKYKPLWLNGGGHTNLELYPEYIKHLKKFVSEVCKPKDARNYSNNMMAGSVDQRKPAETQIADTDSRLTKPPQISRISLDSHSEDTTKCDEPETSRFSTDNVDRHRKRGLL